jgi:hypothetical protein
MERRKRKWTRIRLREKSRIKFKIISLKTLDYT